MTQDVVIPATAVRGATVDEYINNDIPGITMRLLCPGKKITVKCMGQSPDITIFDIKIFPI